MWQLWNVFLGPNSYLQPLFEWSLFLWFIYRDILKRLLCCGQDEPAFDHVFAEANFKSFVLRLRAKMETFNVSRQIVLSLQSPLSCSIYIHAAVQLFTSHIAIIECWVPVVSWIFKRSQIKGLDIYIPPLTGKSWPEAVYGLKWRTDRQWH